MQEEIQRSAIDIGYGDTKVTYEKDGELITFKFPSAVARVKEAQASFGDGAIADSYIFNGKRYFVGEKAQLDAMNTRGLQFLTSYGPLIAFHALTKIGVDFNKPIELSLGLSIMNWSQKDEFLAAMEKFIVNSTVVEPSLNLMAQGEGVLNDYDGDKKGIVCVVDIGYNTFDFLVFDNGEPSPDLSYADPIGANKMITDLQAIAKRRFNVHVTEQMAKEIFINKTVMVFGDEIDFSNEIEELKESYNEFIIEELKHKNASTLMGAKKVIFSGGGAYFLEDTELPKNVVFCKSPYEFSNVRGYFNRGENGKIQQQK
jgi:plasmid segregation protein ParM